MAENADRPIDREELLRLYDLRSEQALQETKRVYGKMIRSIARGILHSGSEAEECENDVLYKLWNAIPSERPRSLAAYIARVARNCALTRLQAQNAARRVPTEMTGALEDYADLFSEADEIDNALEEKELKAILDAFLRTLSKTERLAFVYRFYFSKPIDEIAAILKISRRAVYQSLEKTRKKLQEVLQKEGYRL